VYELQGDAMNQTIWITICIGLAVFLGTALGYQWGVHDTRQPDVAILPIYVDSVGVALGVDSLVCKQFKWMEAGDYD